MTRAPLFAAFLAAGLLASCDDPNKPTDPVWGKQACASCAMVVGDKAFAAELTRASDGERFFFDDPGCMAAFVREKGAAKKMWVKGANGAWVDARSAHFRRGASSPMDYGFVPGADGDADWAALEEEAARRAVSGGAR